MRKFTPKQLAKAANEIVKLAKARGLEKNYFFTTAFARYQAQVNILGGLEEALANDGPMVTKVYVKGRENIYTHPAIGEYNRTTDSANKTMLAILRLLGTADTFKAGGGKGGEDDFEKF